MTKSQLYAAFVAPTAAIGVNISPDITNTLELLIQAVLAVCSILAIWKKKRRK